MSHDRSVVHGIATLMIIEGATLAVASILHLSGDVHGSAPFDADHAGIAEAVIGIVLVGAAITMFRMPARARAVGLAGNGFAVVGFLVGLELHRTGRGSS
jgi:hypothetical protein